MSQYFLKPYEPFRGDIYLIMQQKLNQRMQQELILLNSQKNLI